jgi:hypothetical protein
MKRSKRVVLVLAAIGGLLISHASGDGMPVGETIETLPEKAGCTEKCVYSSCITIELRTVPSRRPICMELEGGPRAFWLITNGVGHPDINGTDPCRIRQSPCSAECDPRLDDDGGIQMAAGSCGGGNGNWQDGRAAEECRAKSAGSVF